MAVRPTVWPNRSSNSQARNARTNHGDWPTGKSSVPAFGDPLLCDKPGPTCPNHWIERDSRYDISQIVSQYQRKSLAEREPPGLSFLELIAGLCKSTGVSKCRKTPSCQKERQQLDKTLPKCQWKSFRDWVLETLACCSIRDDSLGLPKPVLRCISTAINPSVRDQIRPGGDLDVEFEVFRILFWIGNSSESIPISIGHSQLRPGFFLPHMVRPAIFRAAHQSNDLGICPNRLWNIASASPCREADIPTLVDAISRSDQRESFRQSEHRDCTADFCEVACENATLKQQLHKCENVKCTSALNEAVARNQTTLPRMQTYTVTVIELFIRMIVSFATTILIKLFAFANPGTLRSFPQNMIVSAINKDKPAIWKIGEKPDLLDIGDAYIAVSHVWSDGTGVGVQEAGKVNPCLFDYFAKISDQLGCDGIWWDTISIPTERKARAKALSGMQRVFEMATWTVVHDEFLVQFPWSDDGLPCVAVILSSWFTRGWTALELAFSKNVKIIFKDSKTGSHVLKDLDKDVLAPGGRPSPLVSYEHWIATTFIRRARRYDDTEDFRGEFLHSLALRTTSWPRDRAIIAALMAGVKNLRPGMTQAEITRITVMKLGSLSGDFLFHGFPTMTDQGSFSWCPHTFFSGQRFVGSECGDGSRFEIQTISKEGEIRGHWRASILSETIADNIKPRSFHFSVDLKIKHALRHWESCLLIDLRHQYEYENETWQHSRVFDTDKLCILVVVLGCEEYAFHEEPILDCQYIGCVYEPSGLVENDTVVIRFGRIAGKSGVNAAEMLRDYGLSYGRKNRHLPFNFESRGTPELD